MATNSANNSSPAPIASEKKKELSAWIVFAKPEMFMLTFPVDGSVILPVLENGDALLFADRENKVATGVRRLYLIRNEEKKTILYFDRIVDFESPIPLDELQYTIPEAPAAVWKLEVPKLERALQIAKHPEFKALPEISPYDRNAQNYVRNLLQQAVVDDLLGPARGPEEEIVGMSVRDRYLVGKLAPKVPYDDGSSDSPFTADEPMKCLPIWSKWKIKITMISPNPLAVLLMKMMMPLLIPIIISPLFHLHLVLLFVLMPVCRIWN